MTGFIKDYRQELESDIWLMPPMYHRVWQWLKYQVNHRDNEIPMRDGSKLNIKRGQHLTSVRNIAQSVGYYEGAKWKEPNPKTISAILVWLEKQGMISLDRGQGNRQYTLITLLNWDLYQDRNSQGNSKYTADGEGREHLVDINKNEKNVKNEKKNTSRLKYEISDMENAKLLFQLMLENNENCKEPNLESWANEMRLMRERDKRTEEQIQYVMKWSQRDPFWKTNILSPSKLRKQFDQLIMRIKEEREKRKKEIKQEGFDLSE
ncbi:hypothetical protein [Bacillus cereus]|uniref:DnaD domain-containing protein n=1 Tax=Bacillus cereus VD184 TaxID=1053242 RepID=A0A9W5VUS8_BACCE|nr:hypothetical protein [Bacillus cereus]EOQ18640.1 hypothetical protein IKC_05141 [Bacillus cereus VD184]